MSWLTVSSAESCGVKSFQPAAVLTAATLTPTNDSRQEHTDSPSVNSVLVGDDQSAS